MDISLINQSISSAYEVITAFKERLYDLSTSDYSSETPRLFLDLLLKLATVLETRLFSVYLSQVRDLANQPETPDNLKKLHDLERNIPLLISTIGGLSGFVRFVDAARSHAAPWGIINQFERLSRAIVDNSRVIVSPTWEYNYLYFSIDYYLKFLLSELHLHERELYEALVSVFKGFPRFFNLSYPSIHMENVLQLADWAHELGHSVDNYEGEKATGNGLLYLSSEVIGKQLRIHLRDDEWDYLKQQFREELISQIVPMDELDFSVDDYSTFDRYIEELG